VIEQKKNQKSHKNPELPGQCFIFAHKPLIQRLALRGAPSMPGFPVPLEQGDFVKLVVVDHLTHWIVELVEIQLDLPYVDLCNAVSFCFGGKLVQCVFVDGGGAVSFKVKKHQLNKFPPDGRLLSGKAT
jgi:hypothetical protein